MSLMMSRSSVADLRMVETYSACSASSSVLSSRLVKPMTPFIGVRISWLMLARNSDLARLASRARRRAMSSSRFCTSTASSVSRSSCVAWSMRCCISARASSRAWAMVLMPRSRAPSSPPEVSGTRVERCPWARRWTAAFRRRSGSLRRREARTANQAVSRSTTSASPAPRATMAIWSASMRSGLSSTTAHPSRLGCASSRKASPSRLAKPSSSSGTGVLVMAARKTSGPRRARRQAASFATSQLRAAGRRSTRASTLPSASVMVTERTSRSRAVASARRRSAARLPA